MKKISFNSFVTSVLIFSIFYACENNINEQEDVYSKIIGHVYNEYDQPLCDAIITIGSDFTTSNSNGYFSFNSIIIGEHLITVSKENYISISKPIEIYEDSIKNLDFTLLQGIAFISLSDTIKELSANNGTFSISVSSNTNWYVKNRLDWISISDSIGEGNSYLTIKYTENNTDEIRTDTFKIISGTIVKNIILTQNFKTKIIETKGIIANEELDIVDSFLVRFNKPINLITIKSNESLCFSDIDIIPSNNNKDFIFSYACGQLGGSYSFKINATDFDGFTIAKDIDIPLYSIKHQFEGYITDYYLINNSNEMYISTNQLDGGTIYHYSIETDSILNSFNLTGIVSPYRFSLNLYDNKLYIVGSTPGYKENTGILDTKAFTSNVPKIYRLNTNTGIVEDSIEILADELDHPQSPKNIPIDIGFTRSGMGIIILKAIKSSGYRWKFIDTSNNDSIFYYTDDTFSEYYEYCRVYENYNFTKLFLLSPYGSLYYGIYDNSQKSMSSIISPVFDRSYDLIPNKNEETIFVRQLYTQFMMNIQGETGTISHLDSRHAGRADFDYSDETNQTIFIYEDQSFVGNPNKFRVLDYLTGSTILKCDALDDLYRFSTTSDGKWALAYSLKYPYQSSLYIFNTKMLKRKN